MPQHWKNPGVQQGLNSWSVETKNIVKWMLSLWASRPGLFDFRFFLSYCPLIITPQGVSVLYQSTLVVLTYIQSLLLLRCRLNILADIVINCSVGLLCRIVGYMMTLSNVIGPNWSGYVPFCPEVVCLTAVTLILIARLRDSLLLIFKASSSCILCKLITHEKVLVYCEIQNRFWRFETLRSEWYPAPANGSPPQQ